MEIELRKITKSFGQTLIFAIEKHVFRKGSITELHGENGTGKSTLFNIICGFDKEFSGRVLFDNMELEKPYYRGLGYVRQRPHMFIGTVYENIEFPLKNRGKIKSERDKKIEELLETYDLKTLVGQKSSTLSGGERQRLAIARAIAADPRVLLLDESTANMHSDSVVRIEEALKEYNKKTGCTMVVVSHHRQHFKNICTERIDMGMWRAGEF